VKLTLREDIATAWFGRDAFEVAQAQQGQIFRDKEGRRTLRFELGEHAYFLKLHQGVGWPEIFKNLLQLRLPVIGASNEYRAILALEKLSIDTLSIAGYGQRGNNPATQLSFLITDELTGVETLEDFCGRWPQQPPTFALKTALILRLADISRRLHAAGINHRDYYLCHFLLDTRTPVRGDNLADHRLYLMDLHRAQIRQRVPKRWLVKDLGALYFSALHIGLTRRDVLRFMRAYRQQPLREILNTEKSFWLAVLARAEQIYRRDYGSAPTSKAWLG
jgi:lipopolysaccharide core heptose(I) kinase